MAMLAIEYDQGVLWLSGNVLPSQEQKLSQALSRYLDDVDNNDHVVDMSAVKYLSSYAAKTVLTVAQEANERGSRLRVRSSLPVVRTLTLLGAQSWCELETCRKPNRWPRTEPERRSKEGLEYRPEILPVKRNGTARVNSIPKVGRMPAAMVLPDESVISTAELDAPVTEIESVEVDSTAKETNLQPSAPPEPWRPLVSEESYLPEDLFILRTLVPMKTYSFQMMGVKAEITGKVLERVGGPWILIDSNGTRKMVNVRKTMAIDVLT